MPVAFSAVHCTTAANALFCAKALVHICSLHCHSCAPESSPQMGMIEEVAANVKTIGKWRWRGTAVGIRWKRCFVDKVFSDQVSFSCRHKESHWKHPDFRQKSNQHKIQQAEAQHQEFNRGWGSSCWWSNLIGIVDKVVFKRTCVKAKWQFIKTLQFSLC